MFGFLVNQSWQLAGGTDDTCILQRTRPVVKHLVEQTKTEGGFVLKKKAWRKKERRKHSKTNFNIFHFLGLVKKTC